MKDLGKDFYQTKKPLNIFQKFLLKILFYEKGKLEVVHGLRRVFSAVCSSRFHRYAAGRNLNEGTLQQFSSICHTYQQIKIAFI